MPSDQLLLGHIKRSRVVSTPLLCIILLGVVGACRSNRTRGEAPATGESAARSDPGATPAQVSGRAELGKRAPDFTLNDLDGKPVRLADQRGKVVVLEWFNPGCPFVKAAHTKGSLVGTAKRYASAGVVWLAINSAAPGKQGHGIDTNRAGVATYALHHPILIDETGQVGRAYGAQHTPHMFVIDKQGNLVYRGAIDNSPDGEGESPTGDRLINHVDTALADLNAGRPVVTPETEAYGCSVKYAN